VLATLVTPETAQVPQAESKPLAATDAHSHAKPATPVSEDATPVAQDEAKEQQGVVEKKTSAMDYAVTQRRLFD
jgi:hypothetical protein